MKDTYFNITVKVAGLIIALIATITLNMRIDRVATAIERYNYQTDSIQQRINTANSLRDYEVQLDRQIELGRELHRQLSK